MNKRIAFGALWAALAVQTVWMGEQIAKSQSRLSSLAYPIGVTLAFAALAVTAGIPLPRKVIGQSNLEDSK